MSPYIDALEALQREADAAVLYEEYDENVLDEGEDEDSDEEKHGPCAVCSDPECSAEQHADEWNGEGQWEGF